MCNFPQNFFPFNPQYSDQHLLPVEEWRRIPRADASTDQSNLDNSSADSKDSGGEK